MSEQEPRKDPRVDVETKHHRDIGDDRNLAVEELERDTTRLSIEQT
jgi:hypothetical protein